MVILTFLTYMGFACLPPLNADLRHASDAGYMGPWLMSESEAVELIRTAPERGISEDRYRIVRPDDQEYKFILERCPPVFALPRTY